MKEVLLRRRAAMGCSRRLTDGAATLLLSDRCLMQFDVGGWVRCLGLDGKELSSRARQDAETVYASRAGELRQSPTSVG